MMTGPAAGQGGGRACRVAASPAPARTAGVAAPPESRARAPPRQRSAADGGAPPASAAAGAAPRVLCDRRGLRLEARRRRRRSSSSAQRRSLRGRRDRPRRAATCGRGMTRRRRRREHRRLHRRARPRPSPRTARSHALRAARRRARRRLERTLELNALANVDVDSRAVADYAGGAASLFEYGAGFESWAGLGRPRDRARERIVAPGHGDRGRDDDARRLRRARGHRHGSTCSRSTSRAPRSASCAGAAAARGRAGRQRSCSRSPTTRSRLVRRPRVRRARAAGGATGCGRSSSATGAARVPRRGRLPRACQRLRPLAAGAGARRLVGGLPARTRRRAARPPVAAARDRDRHVPRRRDAPARRDRPDPVVDHRALRAAGGRRDRRACRSAGRDRPPGRLAHRAPRADRPGRADALLAGRPLERRRDRGRGGRVPVARRAARDRRRPPGRRGARRRRAALHRLAAAAPRPGRVADDRRGLRHAARGPTPATT